MNILILEDEAHHRDILQNMLLQWSKEKNIPIMIKSFQSGEMLIDHCKASGDMPPDIIFMDIKLDGITGLKTAEILRMQGYQNAIIFTTNYREFSLKGYSVQAINYLVKPIEYIDLALCMDQFEQNTHFSFSQKGEHTKIPYNDILYFESTGHYIKVHTSRPLSSPIKFRYKMSDLSKKSLPKRFIQCHRSFVINLSHTVRIVDQTIEMDNGTVIAIGRTYLSNVLNSFSKLSY